MTYTLETTHRYRKSFAKLSPANKKAVKNVLRYLLSGERLEARYRDHVLKGDLKGYRECHVRPDLLLVYAIDHGTLILTAIDVGSHSALFP